MKTKLINLIKTKMKPYLNEIQILELNKTLSNVLTGFEVIKKDKNLTFDESKENHELLMNFLSAKQIEGCSERTINYYKTTIFKMLISINLKIENITTDDLRKYLSDYKNQTDASKTTVDNIRRVLSSFFSWLEDEDYILKNPVRRIHKIKTRKVVKEVLSDENFEVLRDNCGNIRDLAMIELLASTGIRVGELVNLNIDDILFNERECVVLGKGDSERMVYFDAKTKIHLLKYLESRKDSNPALFVSFKKPHRRLGINGVERRIRELGHEANIKKVHPHKFRRTMATNAIDKGMPIEQVQKLLGHVQIDTTMQYAMVNQSNVKIAHRKFIG
ncbi:site-specific tyrosine recombinase/integron integrase [Methanobrevibacter sp.]